MKRLSTGVLAALLTAGLGLSAVAAPSQPGSHGNLGTNVVAQASPAPPPMNFGSPPSGQIPILYNDHHVYAKPDELKQGRVLAALVRGGTILIPLRSMFEQMGATVAYDPASKTVDVTKPGSDVKVTVGKPEVVINGETRPLDVPPEIYQGHVVVPVRVSSRRRDALIVRVVELPVVAFDHPRQVNEIELPRAMKSIRETTVRVRTGVARAELVVHLRRNDVIAGDEVVHVRRRHG